jgi:hypothetical protein
MVRRDDPKENILSAATKVFAERGFRDATVIKEEMRIVYEKQQKRIA